MTLSNQLVKGFKASFLFKRKSKTTCLLISVEMGHCFVTTLDILKGRKVVQNDEDGEINREMINGTNDDAI